MRERQNMKDNNPDKRTDEQNEKKTKNRWAMKCIAKLGHVGNRTPTTRTPHVTSICFFPLFLPQLLHTQTGNVSFLSSKPKPTHATSSSLSSSRHSLFDLRLHPLRMCFRRVCRVRHSFLPSVLSSLPTFRFQCFLLTVLPSSRNAQSHGVKRCMGTGACRQDCI